MKSITFRSHTVVFEFARKSSVSGFVAVGLVDQTLPVISYWRIIPNIASFEPPKSNFLHSEMPFSPDRIHF